MLKYDLWREVCNMMNDYDFLDCKPAEINVRYQIKSIRNNTRQINTNNTKNGSNNFEIEL